MSTINTPTQKERLRQLRTPKQVADYLSANQPTGLVRQILTAYVVGDLVQASEAESAYDQGYQDAMRRVALLQRSTVVDQRSGRR